MDPLQVVKKRRNHSKFNVSHFVSPTSFHFDCWITCKNWTLQNLPELSDDAFAFCWHLQIKYLEWKAPRGSGFLLPHQRRLFHSNTFSESCSCIFFGSFVRMIQRLWSWPTDVAGRQQRANIGNLKIIYARDTQYKKVQTNQTVDIGTDNNFVYQDE